ncbi:cupin domain-containing protein [Sporomusa aerivorans]|uniref:cupin domain-containing protein n=1 Tax=Sporomusa aerivorans TaxID=204936 RepID=UPI00352A2243
MSNTNLPYKQLDEKTTRRVLSYGQDLMLVEFVFKQGGVGTPHKHEEHEQIGYVAQGSFELMVGEEKSIIKRGDTYYAPRNTLHGVVALEDDSILIDAFTPIRADFL